MFQFDRCEIINDMPVELDLNLFTQFLEGKIDGSSSGPAYTLTLLAMMTSSIYFEPGFMPTHKGMLAELDRPVGDVVYAGRVSQKNFGNRKITLLDGGGTLSGYIVKNDGRGFVIAALNLYLQQLNDSRRVVREF